MSLVVTALPTSPKACSPVKKSCQGACEQVALAAAPTRTSGSSTLNGVPPISDDVPQALVHNGDVAQHGRHLRHQGGIRAPTWCHLTMQDTLCKAAELHSIGGEDRLGGPGLGQGSGSPARGRRRRQ